MKALLNNVQNYFCAIFTIGLVLLIGELLGRCKKVGWWKVRKIILQLYIDVVATIVIPCVFKIFSELSEISLNNSTIVHFLKVIGGLILLLYLFEAILKEVILKDNIIGKKYSLSKRIKNELKKERIKNMINKLGRIYKKILSK